MYTFDKNGITQDHPLALFYTSGGQLSGSQIYIFDPKGDVVKNQELLVEKGFIEVFYFYFFFSFLSCCLSFFYFFVFFVFFYFPFSFFFSFQNLLRKTPPTPTPSPSHTEEAL